MIATEDSYGNFTPQVLANKGEQFHVEKQSSGSVLKIKGQAASPNGIELANNLQQGSINANIYKNGKLLLSKTNITPEQKVVFEFKPTIWIGVASQVNEGELVSSAAVSSLNTEISLVGITSADIVMTGGGTGSNATAFQFSLENVIKA